MPQRLSRTVAALVAVGAIAAFLGLFAAPASADQVRHEQWWLTSAGIAATWPASQGAGVTVALLSDGVQPGEPDLNGAVSFAPAPAGAPVAASPYSGQVGTALASLIAGRGHGGGGSAGVIGVAPAATIMSVPVTLPGDDPALTAPSVAATIPAAIAAGVRYAVRHGARVIDLPIDPGQPDNAGYSGDSAAAGGSQAEQSAISYALRHDVVLVAPAGDNAAAGDAASYPAAYRGVIAVGATDSASQLATWSSQQSYVALTAPGVEMVAASNAGGYLPVSSTSAASAIVAGIAALIRSRYPALTADQVRAALISGASHRPAGQSAAGWGSGGVNAVAAMAAAARLGTPHARLAGAGGRPHVIPAAVRQAPHGTAAGIERAGEISAALLGVLLLLIGARLLIRRRRDPLPEPAAGRAQRKVRSRYPMPPDEAADLTPAVGAPGPPGPAQAGLVDGEARGVPLAGSATGSAYPPASRGPGRRPAVSGAPPWEPAVAPTSELPWTSSAGRHSAGGRPVPPSRTARARSAGRARPRPRAEPAIESLPAGLEQSGGSGQRVTTLGPGQPPSGQPPSGQRLTTLQPGQPPSGQPQQARQLGTGQPDSLDPREPGPGEPQPPAARSQPGARVPSRPRRRRGASAAPGPSAPDPSTPSLGASAYQPSRLGPSSQDPSTSGPASPGPSAPWASSPSGSSDSADRPVHRAPRPPMPMLPSPTPPDRPVAPSGLPVRRPGATQSAPLSPSGSLWQSLDDTSSGSLWERPAPRAQTPADDQAG